MEKGLIVEIPKQTNTDEMADHFKNIDTRLVKSMMEAVLSLNQQVSYLNEKFNILDEKFSAVKDEINNIEGNFDILAKYYKGVANAYKDLSYFVKDSEYSNIFLGELIDTMDIKINRVKEDIKEMNDEIQNLLKQKLKKQRYDIHNKIQGLFGQNNTIKVLLQQPNIDADALIDEYHKFSEGIDSIRYLGTEKQYKTLLNMKDNLASMIKSKLNVCVDDFPF